MLNSLMILSIILSISTSISCEQVSYNNYKVFRIVPTTSRQIEVLLELENTEGYSFWSEPHGVSMPIDLQVPPIQMNQFYELMKNESINYKVSIENVQDKLNEQNISFNSRANGNNVDWTHYNTLDEIYTWIDQIAESYGRPVERIIGGSTYHGRQIKGLKISFNPGSPGAFLEGGIHPREWISPATVTYLIHKFLYSNKPAIRQLAESYDWYIFPVVNPDGYEYTYSENGDRLWRKTVSDTGAGLNPANHMCKGVDMNRNFGYMWQAQTSIFSRGRCSDTYPGTGPFSEIETRTLSYFIESIQENLFAYLSLHSYSQALLFPYACTKKHADDHERLLAIGRRAISALSKRYGTEYKIEKMGESFSVACGVAVDWAKGFLKIPLTYNYEMRDQGEHRFLLPPEQIVPNSKEVLDSLIAMFDEAQKLSVFEYKEPGLSSSGSASGSHPHPGHGSGSASGSRPNPRQYHGSGSGSKSSKMKLPMCLGG